MEQDIFYMNLALEQARQAAIQKEVPIGAIIVCGGVVVAAAYNTRETKKNALHHAEILAIDEACRKLGGWRLHKCDLYVTVEPCPMCAGAIVNARIKRVIYGVKDAKAGAFGSVLQLNYYPLNHKPEIISGVCETECRTLLQDFFARLRKQRKKH